MRKVLIVIILFIFSALLAYIIQKQPDAYNKPLNELVYFPSGKYVSQIALDYKGLIADMLWLQVIQYYGQHAMTDMQFEHLYRLFNVITILDKDFLQCYVFGGTIITYDQKSPELGLKLLDKGMINMPDSWQIPFMKGFLNYVYLRDYDAARIWFAFASTKPDAPYSCKAFAAASMMRKGDYITSMRLWSNMYIADDNKYIKEKAVFNITKLVEKELNRKMQSMTFSEFRDFFSEEIKAYDFLPFGISIKLMGDSIIVEEQL